MKILITNDDGIQSPALPLLAEWAKKLGDVTVAAPKVEQSGKSQAINFMDPVEITQVDLVEGVTAYSVDSSPADCVRFGVLGLNQTYDLIISGINRGYNLGDDIVYSGTCGAIFEGSRLGINGLALSTDPDNLLEAPKALDVVWEYIQKNNLYDYNNLYNINIFCFPFSFVFSALDGEFNIKFVCLLNIFTLDIISFVKGVLKSIKLSLA